ncbi:MAG: exonuclease SbcCD subunit D C-terminal domain-containing protein [Xanthomonadales bacterium]|nr:exonuclease SbcCD subunit D C-terminal domain-containing protein [Xanthomonadales bacterium]
MRLIHTSDWHLGHALRQHDRSHEHQCFLDWLLQQLLQQQADVLLVAGDLFDTVNPSAQAQAQLYRFLAWAHQRMPGLQTVLIAGNHDSAARLEAPQPLLESLAVRVVGQVHRKPAGEIDLDRMLLPLGPDLAGPTAVCLAVPYLRPADLPVVEEGDPYLGGIERLYRDLHARARALYGPSMPLIAMGHCHVRGGQSSIDSERRLVIGGSEALPAAAFPEDLAYAALGHLHLAQAVSGRNELRYCGAPLPFSFGEARYPHQILRVDLGRGPARIETLRVPRFVELQRIPAEPKPLAEVLALLADLSETALPLEMQPLLEVRVLLDAPLPDLRRQVEGALQGKPVRLLRIDPHYRQQDPAKDEQQAGSLAELQLDPVSLLREQYRQQYGESLPTELEALLLELVRADRGEAA